LQIDETKARYRYVYYWICNEYLKLKALGRGSQDNLNADMIKNYPILVPDLDAQDKIISALDKYAALESEYEESLQKEIQLRQTQYEYYRDKLLTFQEAN
jgi:type I restriction enzyme S subunit